MQSVCVACLLIDENPSLFRIQEVASVPQPIGEFPCVFVRKQNTPCRSKNVIDLQNKNKQVEDLKMEKERQQRQIENLNGLLISHAGIIKSLQRQVVQVCALLCVCGVRACLTTMRCVNISVRLCRIIVFHGLMRCLETAAL